MPVFSPSTFFQSVTPGALWRAIWPQRDTNAVVALIGATKFSEYSVYVQARGWLWPLRLWVSGAHQVAIWAYTSPDGWHMRVNEELWDHVVSGEVKGFTSVLNSALSKMNHHSGTVYRGYSDEDVDFFIDGYEVGNIREFAGFTSATKALDLAFYGNILFVVHSRDTPNEDRFPDVERFSAVPEEKEVLFHAGTRFKVRAVARVEESAIIELEQVP